MKQRLVSEHFLRDGSPKRQYMTKADAVNAAGRSALTGKEHVYRCKFCGLWHRAKSRGHVRAFGVWRGAA